MGRENKKKKNGKKLRGEKMGEKMECENGMRKCGVKIGSRQTANRERIAGRRKTKKRNFQGPVLFKDKLHYYKKMSRRNLLLQEFYQEFINRNFVCIFYGCTLNEYKFPVNISSGTEEKIAHNQCTKTVSSHVKTKSRFATHAKDGRGKCWE